MQKEGCQGKEGEKRGGNFEKTERKREGGGGERRGEGTVTSTCPVQRIISVIARGSYYVGRRGGGGRDAPTPVHTQGERKKGKKETFSCCAGRGDLWW